MVSHKYLNLQGFQNEFQLSLDANYNIISILLFKNEKFCSIGSAGINCKPENEIQM